MLQALSQFMTFQEFLAWKPETARYELHDGVIVEMQPTGPHEGVSRTGQNPKNFLKLPAVA